MPGSEKNPLRCTAASDRRLALQAPAASALAASLVRNDLIGDGDLTARAVDGYHRSFDLLGFG